MTAAVVQRRIAISALERMGETAHAGKPCIPGDGRQAAHVLIHQLLICIFKSQTGQVLLEADAGAVFEQTAEMLSAVSENAEPDRLR